MLKCLGIPRAHGCVEAKHRVDAVDRYPVVHKR